MHPALSNSLAGRRNNRFRDAAVSALSKAATPS